MFLFTGTSPLTLNVVFLVEAGIQTNRNCTLLVFPTRVFPNPKPVFWLFSTTRNPGFFNYQTRVIKKMELLLHSIVSNSDNTEAAGWCV